MRRTQQAHKADRCTGKLAKVLTITGKVMTHDDCGIKAIEFNLFFKGIDGSAQHVAIMRFAKCGGMCGPVIKNRDAPAEFPAKA